MTQTRTFDTPINSGDLSLDRVLAAGLPVAVVFLPKQSSSGFESKLNDLASRHAGELLIAKVEAEANPVSVRKYNISTLPALVGVRNQQVTTQVGSISEGELEPQIAYLLGKGPKPVEKSAAQPSQPRPSGKPIAVSEATFTRDVMQSELPVLVDFWAAWCGPCRMVEPFLERMASDLAGKLRIAKVNVDENQSISMRYGVQGIPTMLIVKGGKIVDRWSGALPEAALRQRVSPWLN
ncbi:MAG: thioredoxin [Caldilineaceae bacterium]